MLAWENNVSNLGFQIICRNIIFHFQSVENDIFCEASTRNVLQSGTHSIFTQSSSYLMDIPTILAISPFVPNSGPFN